MASSVATPLERQFGRIAGVNEMTSSSSLGAASVTLQFDIDPQHRCRRCTSTSRPQSTPPAASCPLTFRKTPSYRKANPAEAPDPHPHRSPPMSSPSRKFTTWSDSILAQKISQIQGVGQTPIVGGSAQPAVRVEAKPHATRQSNGVGLEAVRTALANANANRPKGSVARTPAHRWRIDDNDQIFKAR